MKITFIRHGETEENRKKNIQGQVDIPLNDTGRLQAKATATYLKSCNERYTLGLSSSLSRAKETLEILKNELEQSFEIRIDDAFIERDFGALEGRPIIEVIPYLNCEDPQICGYESNDILLNRIKKGIYALYDTYPEGNIIIVSHAQTIKVLLLSLGAPIKLEVPIHNGSVHTIEVHANHMQLTGFHIYPKQ